MPSAGIRCVSTGAKPVDGVKLLKTKFFVKSITALSGFALSGLMFTTSVDAANPETVVVEVTFVAAITIVETNALQFGLLDEALNTETIIIATDDGLTDAGNIVIGGLQRAADLTITAQSGVSMNITIGDITPFLGYTLTDFKCDYELGTITACDGTGYTVTSVTTGALRVGVTLTGTNLAVAGVANGSFTVTVSYI